MAIWSDSGSLDDPLDSPLPAPFEACLPNEGGPARGCLTSSGRATGTRTVMHRAGALRGATEKSCGVAEGSSGQKVWSEVRLLVVYNDSRPICYSTPQAEFSKIFGNFWRSGATPSFWVAPRMAPSPLHSKLVLEMMGGLGGGV